MTHTKAELVPIIPFERKHSDGGVFKVSLDEYYLKISINELTYFISRKTGEYDGSEIDFTENGFSDNAYQAVAQSELQSLLKVISSSVENKEKVND